MLGLAFAADAPVREYVRSHATEAQRGFADFVTQHTYSPWLLGSCALGWLAARALRRREWQRRWLAVMAATALAGIAVNIPRGLTGRARPSNTEAQGWFGLRHEGEWIVARHKFNSFPSGHATTAAGFGTAALLCFPRLGWLGVAVALVTGWSRIWMSAHHFSDVAVGLVLGGFLGWCAWRWFLDRGWITKQ